jgi:uncharacterized SAM-binding protein YcdF (DUF218 family)
VLENLRPHARRALRDAGGAVGVFIALNLAGEAIRGPFETLSDWVSLPDARWLRLLLAGMVGAALLVNAAVHERAAKLRRAGAWLFSVVAALAVIDVARFWATLARGTIHTPAVLPASALVAAFFAALALELRRSEPAAPVATRPLARAAMGTAVLLALPLVRIVTFGPTRYDRPAACAVVFGARVWNDGTPSDALADRVDEAVELYRRGLASKIVMSGGVEPQNGLSEAVVMRARAVSEGVPSDDVILDEAGVDTARTVQNTAALMRHDGLESALVVTHYYHEPRAKMLFDRAGIRSFTVPATMKRRLLKEPYFLLREVAAYWHAFVVD